MVSATAAAGDHVIDTRCRRIAINAATTISGKDRATSQGNCVSIWNANKTRKTNHRWQRRLSVRVVDYSIRLLNHQGTMVKHED